MISYPEAVTIVGSLFVIGWTVVKSKNGNSPCKLHYPLMSDLASIKSAVVNLAVYVLKAAEKEGRDLQQEIINAMMKK
jgi:hypothetical protein